jgi:alcohol dehydrogenase class IV
MRFEFATATRIIFGSGTLREAGPLAAGWINDRDTSRVLIVTGRSIQRAQRLLDLLASEQLDCCTFSVSGEPTVELVQRGTRLARDENCGLVVGFGGGSVVDTGKAIAALATNEGEPLDYLEVIGRGQPLKVPPLPYIAVPTTAGTGAEVTRNAVLASAEHRVKVSLRSPLMLPRVALVDPDLTCELPPDITANTGLDALTQLIEAFVSVKANPLTDGICREGIRRASRSLRTVCWDGQDKAARGDMSLASLFSGLALANAGLGAVHGFAGPIGGMFDAPHGAVCAALLPHVMAVNVRVLRTRNPESPVLGRYGEVAQLATGDAKAVAENGIEWLRQLCSELAIQPLRTCGLSDADVPTLVEKGWAASSMKGNPVALTDDDLREILTSAL